MTYARVSDHRRMALDAIRNDAYAAALRQAITPDSVVLDLGAGIGVHGLMAARLGARRVYLVEPEDIIAVAKEIVEANGLGDVVQCLQGRIEDVKPPEPVTVIVSALTGNFLVTEDLLPSLIHARDTLLAPGGVLIPSMAVMEAVPVSAPALHERVVAGWTAPRGGIDLGAARRYAANTVFYGPEELREATWLAEPRALHTIDFAIDGYTGVNVETSYQVERAGACHGWAGWFRMKLGDRWLCTSPRDPEVHWSPVFLPVDPAIALEEGERVSFSLTRPPFGDWSWSIETSAGVSRHSTFLSTPMSTATLGKAALGYEPALSAEGKALLYVLSRCDGTVSVDRLADSLLETHPERFAARADALRFVQRVVRRYT